MEQPFAVAADRDDPVVPTQRGQRESVAPVRSHELASITQGAHLGPGGEADHVGDPAEVHMTTDDHAVV